MKVMHLLRLIYGGGPFTEAHTEVVHLLRLIYVGWAIY